MSSPSRSLRELSDAILKGRLSILTGKVNCGKSAFVATFIAFVKKEFPQVTLGGFLCRGLFDGSAKTGYEMEDLKSGDSCLFALHRSVMEHKKDPNVTEGKEGSKKFEGLRTGKNVPVGQWLILEDSLGKAKQAVREAIRKRRDLVVIDEFGMLELEGRGLRLEADELARSGRAGLLVVREDLLAEVQRVYEPFITNIVPVSSLKSDSYVEPARS